MTDREIDQFLASPEKRKELAMKFKQGDRVFLKSGSPQMTVESFSYDVKEREFYGVVWFDTDSSKGFGLGYTGAVRRDTFDGNLLRMSDANAADKCVEAKDN